MRGLRSLQREVLEDLNGLRERGERERASDFLEPREGGVEDRWHVYAHGYLARLVEALEADYPAVRRILGEGPFAALAERYVRAFPPRAYDLGRAGDLLPEHLTIDPLASDLPFLADLARLERAVAEAFVAPDAALLEWEMLSCETPERVAALPLVLAPGTTLVASRWPVVSLWRTRLEADGEVSVPLDRSPETALVFRSSLTVTCARLDARETTFAVALTGEGGVTLSMLESRLAPAGDADSLASLLGVFRSFVERGAFALPTVPTRSAGTPGSDI